MLLAFSALLAGCQSGGGSDQVAQKKPDAAPEATSPNATGSGSTPAPTPPVVKDEKGNPVPEAASKMPTMPTVKQNFKEIPAPKTNGWDKSDLTGAQLADKVGSAIAGLKQVTGKAVVDLRTPEGKGQFNLQYEIGEPGKYRLNYLRPTVVPEASVVVSDGAKKVWLEQDGFSDPIPTNKLAPDASVKPADLAPSFPKRYTRLMFANLTDKTDYWKPLFSQLLAQKDGISTVVEKRVMPFEGRQITSYRLRARRSDEAAKKYGPYELEVVIDGHRFLPVTVRSRVAQPGGEVWQNEWSMRWDFAKRPAAGTFEIRRA